MAFYAPKYRRGANRKILKFALLAPALIFTAGVFLSYKTKFDSYLDRSNMLSAIPPIVGSVELASYPTGVLLGKTSVTYTIKSPGKNVISHYKKFLVEKTYVVINETDQGITAKQNHEELVLEISNPKSKDETVYRLSVYDSKR